MTTLEITRIDEPEFQTVYATNGGTDKEPDAFHFQFNPHRDSVYRAIVEAIALIHHCDPDDLDPLGSSIEPDALAKLMRTREQSVKVTFHYEDMEVTVESEGDIWLRWE